MTKLCPVCELEIVSTYNAEGNSWETDYHDNVQCLRVLAQRVKALEQRLQTLASWPSNDDHK